MQFNPIQIPSAGGMIAAYENGQDRRIRQMMVSRTIRREDGLRRGVSRFFGGGDDTGVALTGGPAAVASYGGQIPAVSGVGGAYGNTPGPTELPELGRTTGPAGPSVDGSPPPRPDTNETGTASFTPSRSPPNASPFPAPAGGGQINRAALAEIAQYDTGLAIQLSEMDRNQRRAVLEDAERSLDIAGRVYASVSALPAEQQNAEYQRLRAQLEAARIADLPDEWDPTYAQARMRLGMKVVEALNSDRQDREVDSQIADREADNALAERQFQSLDAYRGAQIGLGQDRNDISRTDPRRVAPGTNRAPSVSSVIGGILERQAHGEPLTAAEQRTLAEHRAGSGRGRGRGRAGANGATPTGRTVTGPGGARFNLMTDGSLSPIIGAAAAPVR